MTAKAVQPPAADQRIKELRILEAHYRPVACRSTTPRFSEPLHPTADPLSHTVDEEGKISRTPFQHDRDKILYSRPFRRLRLKSQIYPEQTSDHLRTRLDHTLEVSQLARHLGRRLRLNEDLIDAIALGHDIGHPPFAHSGERALHAFLRKRGMEGFKHNWQGLRIVDSLERCYSTYLGLNLTRAVRIGILHHTDLSYKKRPDEQASCDLMEVAESQGLIESSTNWAFEIQVCRLADDIAQVIHDFEDAVISGMISLKEVLVPKSNPFPLIDSCVDHVKLQLSEEEFQSAFLDDHHTVLALSRIRSRLIWVLTSDAIREARPRLDDWETALLAKCNLGGADDEEPRILAFEEFCSGRGKFPELIALSKDTAKKFSELKKKLQKRLVESYRISRMDGKADYVLRRILEIYTRYPRQAPSALLEAYLRSVRIDEEKFRSYTDEHLRQVGREPGFLRAAVDYVAGMTDRFALREYDQLYSAYPQRDNWA